MSPEEGTRRVGRVAQEGGAIARDRKLVCVGNQTLSSRGFVCRWITVELCEMLEPKVNLGEPRALALPGVPLLALRGLPFAFFFFFFLAGPARSCLVARSAPVV